MLNKTKDMGKNAKLTSYLSLTAVKGGQKA